MKFKIIETLGKPEYVIDTLYNSQDVPSGAGDVLCYDVTAADGSTVTQPVTANLMFAAGVANEAIAAKNQGEVVRRGVAKALVTNQTAVAVGDILIPVTGQDYLIRSGAADVASRARFKALEAYGTTTDTQARLKKVYVDC